MDEQDISQLVLDSHERLVSMSLTWAGIDEDRADYLGDYKNIVRDLGNPHREDWPLLRAAMHHIAHAQQLNLEHNLWLGEEILASFGRSQYDLQYLVLDTRSDRPVPQIDPQEMFPRYRMTAQEATYYYCRAALAILVSKDDPHRAIELFEELDSIFDVIHPSYCLLPTETHSFLLEHELDRLPVLYERVARYEDALNYTPISFDLSGRSGSSCDVAIRRLEGWLEQLRQSGGIAAVERCLDMIYEWLDSAADVDEEERNQLEECPTATRQFWAWYYGNALGRLLVARPSLLASLRDEIEAGDWQNCWHVAAVLFETPPESWSQYRERGVKLYNSSDIEYRSKGPVPWNAVQPPHLSPQSDLYWAMRIGFADAYSGTEVVQRVSLVDVADTLERIETIASSTGQHVLRTERNTDDLAADVRNRIPPNPEYWHKLLQEELPSLTSKLPRAAVDHLIDARRHRFSNQWDACKVSLCKSLEALFVRILVPRIRALAESNELILEVSRGKGSRKYRQQRWSEILISHWPDILRTSTDDGVNKPLRLAFPRAFPDVDLDAVVSLNVELARIAQLRGSSAHDNTAADDRKASDVDECWNLVVGNGEGFLLKFYSALGLLGDGQRSGDSNEA